MFGQALRQHRLGDDQLADEVDQPIELVEIDADRLRGRRHRGARRGRLALMRLPQLCDVDLGHLQHGFHHSS